MEQNCDWKHNKEENDSDSLNDWRVENDLNNDSSHKNRSKNDRDRKMIQQRSKNDPASIEKRYNGVWHRQSAQSLKTWSVNQILEKLTRLGTKIEKEI